MAGTGTRDIFLQANGLRHHLIARGAPGAPVVMLIHGLTQQAHVFDAVAQKLAASFHVYALDVRGRGETEWGLADGYHFANYVADFEAVREELGLERISLVGTSMGGMIALLYAARHPEHVAKLVLNDIGPEIDPAGLARIVKMAASAPQAFPDLKAVVRYYREENAPVLAKRNDDEVLEYARWHVRRSDSGIFEWKMDPAVRVPNATAPAIDPWSAFKAFGGPVLAIRGANSDVLSGAIVAKMREANAQCSAVEVAGVGHAPSLMEPEALKAMQNFLAG
ncbi:MAG: alpha/beta fold hydrolase [Dehalococcoidia bacterium]